MDKDIENIIKVNFKDKRETPGLNKMLHFLNQSLEFQNGILYITIMDYEKRLEKLERKIPHY